MRYPAAEKLEIIQLVEHPICRFGGRWSRSESQDPRSIDGAIFIQDWRARGAGRSQPSA
jgi:hypothetical protein